MSDGIGIFRGVILDCGEMGELLPFYQAVLGPPKFQDGERWAAIQTEGGAVNLAAGKEATGSGVTLAIKVRNIDDAVRIATEAGGRIIGDVERREHEIVAHVADPLGNRLTIYQSA